MTMVTSPEKRTRWNEEAASVLLAAERSAYVVLLRGALQDAGFQVTALSVDSLRSSPVLNGASLILVEMRPGDATIAEVCGKLSLVNDAAVVVFGENLEERDIVPVLEAGADDLLSLPMRPSEVTARLRAVLRRVQSQAMARSNGTIVSGDLEVSLQDHRAFRKGRELSLSPVEHRLLTLLMQEAGRPLSHSKLISHVWGPEYVECRHYLRLYIRYLREKIEDQPHSPKIILNEWGTGYRLQPQDAT
jgi:two-component system KDP operon response regulator KdpE